MAAFCTQRMPVLSQRQALRAATRVGGPSRRQLAVCACQAEAERPLVQRIISGACAAALATAVSLAPLDCTALPAHASSVTVSNDAPVLDLARVVPTGKVDELAERLKQLER